MSDLPILLKIPIKVDYKNGVLNRAWWCTLVIPVLWEAETGGSGFEASLSSLSLSPSLSLSLSVCVSLSVSLSLSLLSEALRNFVRPGFKIKEKK